MYESAAFVQRFRYPTLSVCSTLFLVAAVSANDRHCAVLPCPRRPVDGGRRSRLLPLARRHRKIADVVAAYAATVSPRSKAKLVGLALVYVRLRRGRIVRVVARLLGFKFCTSFVPAEHLNAYPGGCGNSSGRSSWWDRAAGCRRSWRADRLHTEATRPRVGLRMLLRPPSQQANSRHYRGYASCPCHESPESSVKYDQHEDCRQEDTETDPETVIHHVPLL